MKLEEAVQEIKRRVDLVRVIGQTVKLKKNGSHYVGLCPFHAEKSPSFNVRPDKGYYKCFGCGAGGDVFTFLEGTTGQLFIDILKNLASEHGIELEQTHKPRVNTELFDSLMSLQTVFRRQLSGEALRYLTEKRRYSLEFIEKMGLGFGGQQSGLFQSRITIPIKNHRGQLVAFGGRIFGESEKNRPKYINSAGSEIYEKSQVLYGLYESLSLIKQQKYVVLVEGYFDVMALLAVGVPAVAPCGTSLTEAHVELIKKYTEQVVLCFDQDTAGKSAHQKALLLFLNKGFHVQTVILPAKDPDTLWQQGESEKLQKLFGNPKDAVEHRIEQAQQEGLGGVHERIQALEALIPVLSASPDPLVNRQYVRLAAQILKEDESLLVRAVLKNRPGSIARPFAPQAPLGRVIWSDAEKLLLKALLAHPEALRGALEIAEIGFNPELAVFMENLGVLLEQTGPGELTRERLFEIPVPKNSSLTRQISEAFEQIDLITPEESKEIVEGFLAQLQKKKRQNWLREQHQRLVSATAEGNLEEIRETLKGQSGALKKGWT